MRTKNAIAVKSVLKSNSHQRFRELHFNSSKTDQPTLIATKKKSFLPLRTKYSKFVFVSSEPHNSSALGALVSNF